MYNSYTKSPLAWCDQFPSHWNFERAKNLFKKENRPVQPNDGVVTCFRDGTVTLRKNRRLTGFTEAIKEIGYQGIRKGDLVIHGMDAFAGSIGVSDSDGKGSPVYNVCSVKADVNNYYFAYMLRETARNGYIKSLYRGIRERSSDFRFEVFANQFYPVPPREEQNQIVRFLDWKVSEINELIFTRLKELDDLQLSKVQIISSHICGERIRLKRLLKEPLQYGANSSGTSFSPDLPRYIRITDISNDGSLKEDNKKSISNNEALPYMLKDGDILLARSGATVGKAFRFRKNYGTAAYAGYLIRARLKETVILPDYFIYFTSSRMYEEWKKSIFIQATIQNISAEKYGCLPVPVPPLDTQWEIIKYLNMVCSQIKKIQLIKKKEIELLYDLRESIISDVVTGKMDVRGVKIPDYEHVDN